MVTKDEDQQRLHFDFDTMPVEKERRPFVLHMPLCDKGMLLNVVAIKDAKLYPICLKIPFGNLAVTRGDLLHGGCFGSTGNIRFHCIITKVPLYTKKLMYMDAVGGVDIRPENIESHFQKSILSLCEEDPQFKAALMSTGSDLGLVKNDIGCIK